MTGFLHLNGIIGVWLLMFSGSAFLPCNSRIAAVMNNKYNWMNDTLISALEEKSLGTSSRVSPTNASLDCFDPSGNSALVVLFEKYNNETSVDLDTVVALYQAREINGLKAVLSFVA